MILPSCATLLKFAMHHLPMLVAWINTDRPPHLTPRITFIATAIFTIPIFFSPQESSIFASAPRHLDPKVPAAADHDKLGCSGIGSHRHGMQGDETRIRLTRHSPSCTMTPHLVIHLHSRSRA